MERAIAFVRTIGRKLNALEGAPDGTGDCFRQNRLANPRHILDQHMSTADNRDEGQTHGLVLANDDLLDICDDALRGITDIRHRQRRTIFQFHACSRPRRRTPARLVRPPPLSGRTPF